MFRKIDVNDRLPELNKFVTTIDEAGVHRVFRRTEHGWNAREVNGIYSPSDNLPIRYWLEEVVLDSAAIIGEVNERFKELSRYNLDWSSFYDGWLEGRMNLAFSHKSSGMPELQAMRNGDGKNTDQIPNDQ